METAKPHLRHYSRRFFLVGWPGTVEVVTTAARAVKLNKVYGSGETAVTALAEVDLEIEAGKFTAIMGPSGSGKSTLMHLLAALDTPTDGDVYIGETNIADLNDRELTVLRRERIGFIFQAFNLISTLNAAENIRLPVNIARRKVDKDWFDKVVSALDLSQRLSHKPAELSGGQQQRVACARAMMNQPEIIFADEPTGNLDSTAAHEVLKFLRQSVDELEQTIVMVTHDPVAASFADHAVFLSDGNIIEETDHTDHDSLLELMGKLYARPAATATTTKPVAEAAKATTAAKQDTSSATNDTSREAELIPEDPFAPRPRRGSLPLDDFTSNEVADSPISTSREQ